MIEYPIFYYQKLKSMGFLFENFVLRTLLESSETKNKVKEKLDTSTIQAIRESMNALLKKDSENIRDGIYPWSVLFLDNPKTHLKLIPKVAWDSLWLSRRKRNKKTRNFSSSAQEFIKETPKYYQRNFHYQTDGYFSEHSADLYDHQVELLFGGAGDAMRRLFLPHLKSHFSRKTPIDGEGLKILELGTGTGRSAAFTSLVFPKAKIVSIDLSIPYITHAKKRFSNFKRIDFMQMNAEELSFKEDEFDAIFSVFLFHELPEDVRVKVFKEAMRVLKPKGQLSIVDSLQLGDQPSLNSALQLFPEHYHEPFFRNYLETPLESLFKKEPTQVETGFFSKVLSFHKE